MSTTLHSGANHFQSAGRHGWSIDSESELSSIADISTNMAPSDTEDDEPLSEIDTRKYRLPENGKSMLQIRTNGIGSASGLSAYRRASDTTGTPRGAQTPVLKASPGHRLGSYDGSDSDFVSSGHSRTGSTYSLSRVSFTSQLAQLTSIHLPSASSLSARMSSMQTARAAAKALSDAGEQIRVWTRKAAEVLDDLDAKDDVDWAAAGGRDGLEDIEEAIARFEGLVKVYVISVEELQMRKDVSTLSREDLTTGFDQMEGVVNAWKKIKDSLKAVKEQVEIGLEWQELWNNVIGEIGRELDALGGLIFEMEEKRHRSTGFQSFANATRNIDLTDLQNIVEDRPGVAAMTANPRLSLPPPFSPTSPIESPETPQNKDDSNLLALFARMQPMRASLDFLPMRLSVFHCRGNVLFPSACVDLEKRRDALEEQWSRLETDAEAVRRELGEDRWVLVFRNAGKQALKMCESVERSHNKLQDGLLDGTQSLHSPLVARLIESYEAKKTHYAPAIERVLAIIDRGVLDRLTVNGEILRLQSDLKRRWATLQASMHEMDMKVEDSSSGSRGQQLRDSISTILSSERSMMGSSLDTPRSSPASSIVMNSGKTTSRYSATPMGMRRNVSTNELPQPRSSALPRSRNIPRPGIQETQSSRTVSSPLPRTIEPYVGKRKEAFREFKDPLDKPRWSASTAVKDVPNRRDSLQPKATESPRSRKTPSRVGSTQSPSSSIPSPHSLGKSVGSPSPEIASPSTPSTRKYLRATPSPLTPRAATSMSNRTVSAGPKLNAQRLQTPPQQRRPSTPSGSRKTSLLGLPTVNDDSDADTEGPSRSSSRLSRPSSALATSARRRSSLQTPQGVWSRGSGRDSRLGTMGKGLESKPTWKF